MKRGRGDDKPADESFETRLINLIVKVGDKNVQNLSSHLDGLSRALEGDLALHRSLITDTVFDILKNAHVIRPDTQPNVVVCWGGHSIGRTEYEYTKEVGYQLGLRGCDIATGCGTTGAMKGPLKGAAIGHATALAVARRARVAEHTLRRARACPHTQDDLLYPPTAPVAI